MVGIRSASLSLFWALPVALIEAVPKPGASDLWQYQGISDEARYE